MDILTIEQRIKDEYNIVHAWIAVHPYYATFLAFAIGWLAGHLL